MLLERNEVKMPRDLTPEEIELVSGGFGANTDPTQYGEDIVVTGHRDDGNDYDPWEATWFAFDDYYGGYDYGGGGGGGSGDPATPAGNGITDEQRDKALNSIEAARAILQQALERYGPGTMADLNGKLLPVHELLEDLGHLSEILQAGNLVYGLETGDKGLADAIGWLAGLAAVGVAGELGVGVGLAALLGIAVDKLVTLGAEQVTTVVNGVTDTINQQIETFVENHPGPAFDPYDPGAWFDGIFGRPHNPYGGGPGPQNPMYYQ
jgi:hypothetical protein